MNFELDVEVVENRNVRCARILDSATTTSSAVFHMALAESKSVDHHNDVDSISHPGTELNPTKFKRSTRFWFKDGNVVLQAADTQFRVYKGILAAQSDVFETMFSIPQVLLEDSDGALVSIPRVVLF